MRSREAVAIISGHVPRNLPPGQQLVRTLGGKAACVSAKAGSEISLGPLGAALCHLLSIMNTSPCAFCSLVSLPFILFSYLSDPFRYLMATADLVQS